MWCSAPERLLWLGGEFASQAGQQLRVCFRNLGSSLTHHPHGKEYREPINGVIRKGVFSLEKSLESLTSEECQKPNHYFSKKYRNTPPICIAICLPFVPQYFWCPYALRKGKYCQYYSHLYRNTFGKILVVVGTGMFPITTSDFSRISRKWSDSSWFSTV